MEFIYCNEIALDEALAFELIPRADEYLLDSLKNLCEDLLSKRVGKENFIKFLILADTYGAIKLKTACLGFITRNFSMIGNNEELLNIPKHLYLDIVKHAVNTKSKIFHSINFNLIII